MEASSDGLPPAHFVGRRRELAALEAAYRSEGSEFLPIYGRRRVGKSELILRFLRGKGGIYFLGKQAPAGLQIREFLEESARALGEPLLASMAAPGWKEALEAVSGRWRGKGKLVIALDEFQWTAEASPELPSVLQGLLDRKWGGGGRGGQVLLILCGSYLGFMEREVLGKRSPLHGRRTAQIHLKPFDHREAAEFHPGASLEERACAYFVCGGIPLYLQRFSSEASVEMNISRNLLSEFAPLFREPEFLLREELREVENYHAILLALAAGSVTHKAIATMTSVPERSLPYYLEQLLQLGYISRRYPLTGGRPIPRHVRYALDDPLLRFWFRFVYPSLSFISRVGPERAMRERIRPELESYFGGCFERLCREALPLLYAREGVSADFQVGEYWDREVQIDVVGYRDDGRTDLGECKWGSLASAKKVVAELEAKVPRYPNPRGATIGRRIFVRGPLSRGDRPSGIRWHTLEDLYRR